MAQRSALWRGTAWRQAAAARGDSAAGAAALRDLRGGVARFSGTAGLSGARGGAELLVRAAELSTIRP
ncbi:hypothetical protein GCM10010300_14930 [Streptomyces olivaceoviridis]|nr:hypothetical protein GCM10010300_14930 [Streptomyces olivaceoviridis]